MDDPLGVSVVPRGQFAPLPCGRKMGFPLRALVPHFLFPPSSVLPLRPSCLAGHPRALQASSTFSANPSPVDVPEPESSELPAWRAPGHQRWESTSRLSAAGSWEQTLRQVLTSTLSVEVGAGLPGGWELGSGLLGDACQAP